MSFWPAISKRFYPALESLGHRQSRQAGEFLFLEGQPLSGFFVVEKGQLRVFKNSPEGLEATISIAGPGDPISIVPVLKPEKKFHAHCQALVSVEVLYFPLGPLRKFLEQEPRFTLEFATLALERALTVREKYLSLALSDARERFLRFLENQGARKSPVPLPAPKKIIASLLDISPETLSRLMSRLETEKIIRVEKNRIFLPPA